MGKRGLDFWRTHLWHSCRQVHTPLPVSSYSCWACSHQKWTPHTAQGSGCKTNVEKILDTNPPSSESNNALSRKLTEKGLGLGKSFGRLSVLYIWGQTKSSKGCVWKVYKILTNMEKESRESWIEFLYEREGHKTKLEGATSIKQKELHLHTAHS